MPSDVADDNPAMGKLSNGSPIRRARNGGGDARNISQIGVRGLVRKEHWKFIESARHSLLYHEAVRKNGLMEVIMRLFNKQVKDATLSTLRLDIDVVDPALLRRG